MKTPKRAHIDQKAENRAIYFDYESLLSKYQLMIFIDCSE